MKLLSLTILALCIFNSVYSQTLECPATKCAKATEICGVTGNNTYTDCGADSYCTASGLTLGLCVVPFRIGDVCSSDDINGGQCESGTTCKRSGDNSICALTAQSTSYLYAGEGCSDDLQCATSSPYGADDNYDRCRSGKCKHFSTGDYCTSSRGQCNYNNAYCGRTNQCTKYISKGGACYFSDETSGGCGKDYDSACVPNGLEGDAGTCQRLNSRKAGEYCGNDVHCKEGLICRTRDGASRGICSELEATASINRPCTSNIDCDSSNRESCQCGKDGEGRKCYAGVYPDGFFSARKSFEECRRKKGCGTNESAGRYIGCIMDNCKSQYCKYNKVMGKSSTASVSCQYEGICNSAFSLVASPLLALLAFVVVMAL